MDLLRLRHSEEGEPVLILGTGPSLDQLRDTEDIGISTMTMGRSWRKGFSSTHVLNSKADYWDEVIEGRLRPDLIVKLIPNMLTAINAYKYHKSLDHCPPTVFIDFHFTGSDDFPLSLDLTQGSAARWLGVLAMEVALWMGYSPIYLIGYDCGDEGHFIYDRPKRRGGPEHQRPPTPNQPITTWFNRHAATIQERAQVVNLNPDSHLRCFEFGSLSSVSRNAA